MENDFSFFEIIGVAAMFIITWLGLFISYLESKDDDD